MTDSERRCAAVVIGIVVGCLLLHVLRSFAVAAEARGACGGIAGYVVGGMIVATRRRRRS